MENPPVTVLIPVGPNESHKRWLDEAIVSALDQTYRADEILLIDDMAGLNEMDYPGIVRVWESPWLLGVAHAFNFGVALAKNELVFMLGSDDWLEPQCIEACVKVYNKLPHPDKAFLFVGVRYTDDREDKEQFIPCNAAMVTKSLWKQNGGFPIESSSGAPDAALISIMMKNPEAGEYIGVEYGRRSLYNYRVHPETDTAKRQPWQGVILNTRDIVTGTWEKPEWTERGNYELSST